MLVVVFSDIGGYTAGVLFGKHRMVPAISPKKSWEGLAGSFLCGTVAAVLAVAFLMREAWWVGIPLGIMLVITATLGDLVESQVKRDLGIRRHGHAPARARGLMDRIDGALPSAVATWIVPEPAGLIRVRTGDTGTVKQELVFQAPRRVSHRAISPISTRPAARPR